MFYCLKKAETYLEELFCSDSSAPGLEYHIPLDQQSSLEFPAQKKKPTQSMLSLDSQEELKKKTIMSCLLGRQSDEVNWDIWYGTSNNLSLKYE